METVYLEAGININNKLVVKKYIIYLFIQQ